MLRRSFRTYSVFRNNFLFVFSITIIKVGTDYFHRDTQHSSLNILAKTQNNRKSAKLLMTRVNKTGEIRVCNWKLQSEVGAINSPLLRTDLAPLSRGIVEKYDVYDVCL